MYLQFHDKVYDSVNTMMTMCNQEILCTYKTLADCQYYIGYHFSHLNPKSGNIFDPNDSNLPKQDFI